MTTIRERIIASPALQAARAARDLDALAAGLNAEGLRALGRRYVTTRTIMDECGDDAPAILHALRLAADADEMVSETLSFLRDDSGFDIGHPRTQAYVDQFVSAGLMTAAQGSTLKAMGLLPVVVTRDQVNDAMFNPDSSEK